MSVNISNALSDNGHEVILCVSREGGELISAVSSNVELIFLNKRGFFDFKAFCTLLSLVKKRKFEVLHAHSTSIFWASLIKVCNPKIVLLWHDHFGGRKFDKHKNFIYKFLSILFDGVICVSDELMEWSRKNMLLRNKITRIIKINNFPYFKDKFCADKLGTNLKIVMLANFRPEKDHLNLIAALNLIKDKLEENRIIVRLVGKYDSESQYFKSLKIEIERNDLSHLIEIHGDAKNVQPYLGKGHIGVLCSVFEGLPVSLLEYGLASMAVVSTDVGECRKVLGDGKFGEIVPSKDPEKLSKAISRFIDNSDYRISTSEDYNSNVLLKYGKNSFVRRYISFISKL